MSRSMSELLETVIIWGLWIITFIYDVITLPIYFFIQNPWKNLELAHRCKAKAISNNKHQVTYGSLLPFCHNHLLVLKEKADTLEKVFSLVTKKHSQRKCLGTRQILHEFDEFQPDGKILKKYIMGEYKWRSYADAEVEATKFGKGIRELGVKPRDRVAIFAETRAEWMLAAQGLFKHSCGVATIYATLGDDGVIHAINQTEVSVVITSHDLMPKMKKVLNDIPLVKIIIYFEHQLYKTDTSGMDGITLLPYTKILEAGQNSTIESIPPTKDDLAILMYTSGSTGVPKGVQLTHNNLLCTMKGFLDCYETFPTDIGLGLLPLAHSYELLSECSSMLAGIPIGYSTPLTLIDSSPKIARGQCGDAKMLRPTFMTSVPLLLDRIVKGIRDKVENENHVAKVLFNFSLEYKKMWFRRGYRTPLVDRIVFKKIKDVIGGRMRIIISGGAPLSPETAEIVRHCLCVNMCQGYGLTETAAMGTVMEENDLSIGTSGSPSTVNLIRLENWEEGNYFVTNRPNPQGEVIIGGENVATGYFLMPAETKEGFFEENGVRWFRTGDIGEMRRDGSIKIIDRKKDLVKLQHGEYLSLGKIESELKTCLIVENICVYSESFKTYCIALVQPSEKGLNDLAKTLGISKMSYEELCQSKQVIQATEKLIAEYGKAHGLNKFEIPAKIALCTETWTPDSGLVTAAFKIKRKEVQFKYQDIIEMLYS